MSRHALKLVLATFATMATMATLASGAFAAGPVWQLSTTAFPTNIVPGTEDSTLSGPGYFVVATNIGSTPTKGTFTITDVIPAGFSFNPTSVDEKGNVTVNVPKGTYGKENLPILHQLTCGTAGQVVTCTGASPALQPGQTARLVIPLKVAPTVAESVTNTATVEGGGATAVTKELQTLISEVPAPFGFLPGDEGFAGLITNGEGKSQTQAGSHPYQMTVGLNFPSIPGEKGKAEPLPAGGGLRDATVTLPQGVVVNPQATQRCKESELEVVLVPGLPTCPIASQVGTVRLKLGIIGLGSATQPLYNMVPPPGTPGEFAFEVLEGTYVHLTGKLLSEGDYQLSASASEALAKVGVFGVETTLWGDPADPSHDSQRGPCLTTFTEPGPNCSVEPRNVAFLSLPSACSGPLRTLGSVDSWIELGVFSSAGFDFTDAVGNVQGVDGCSQLAFGPTIQFKPDQTQGDSPTSLAVNLHIPQNLGVEDESGNPALATANLRNARVSLPVGYTINPSAANGRTACSAGQIGLTTPIGDPSSIHFTSASPSCPENSKVGSVEVKTPLLDHPLPGSIYLANPYENPFNSLLAIYLVVDDPISGVVVKLAGRVDADATTGQLTSTFVDNPQLPFEDFKLEFFGGPRAALKTPAVCGSYSTQSELAPWSGTAAVSSSADMPITGGAGGGPCASSPQGLPNSPSFEAGTTSPLAGRFAPFVLHLNRRDGSQEFGALSVTLPQGLTGKLAGIPYCPEDAIAAAASKTGREEQASPSCPGASEVGKVTIGAGAGSLPYYVEGRAYLAGPYKGAPLSMAIVTPAVAGPYDLGDVVVRAALEVDPYTAKITVKSDPLPRILKGIPVDVRSIAVEIGRPGFTLNPTSCEPLAITGSVQSTAGQSASLSSHYQVNGCKDLKFKPSLSISLKGDTKRSGHPALKAVVKFPTKGNNATVARAQVGLPHSEFLDQGNLDKVCTQPQLLSATCPKRSIYGHAKAWTPLLDKPLEGPVYLGVGFGYKLPALVADLSGQVRILLKGKVDTTKQNGLRNTFEAVPDAPVSKFILEMKGGKKYGLLENSENICRKTQRASVRLTASNGKLEQLNPLIANNCKKKGGSKKKGSKKQGHQKGQK
jgi:uncharacterized repeat protein (TIGR01451 family)